MRIKTLRVFADWILASVACRLKGVSSSLLLFQSNRKRSLRTISVICYFLFVIYLSVLNYQLLFSFSHSKKVFFYLCRIVSV